MLRKDADKTQQGLLKLAGRMFEHGAEAMRKAHKAWKAGNHRKEKLLLEEKDFFLHLYQVLKRRAVSYTSSEPRAESVFEYRV